LTDQVLITQEDVAVSTWVRLLRGHAALSRAFSAQLQAEHGLTINDYEVLLVLSGAPRGMRRVDLAQKVVLTASGITRLLDGLEAAGLVRKSACSTDARVTYAVLSDEGRRRLRAASADHIAGIRALFGERYSEAELATLAELLGRLPGAGGPDATCAPGEEAEASPGEPAR
jgi:DNA-binding MarR family transcriptional regulator